MVFKMRTYKRKTDRAHISKDLIKQAASEVINGTSIRKAAKNNKIDRTTLSRDIQFSPELVRPLPKAGPRKQQTRRKKRSCAILTDTPEKDALASQQRKRKSKTSMKIEKSKKRAVKKAILISSSESDGESHSDKKIHRKLGRKNKKTNIKKRQLPSDTEEDDCFCLVCTESYSDSLPGEEWIQCSSCRAWAHINCTSGVNTVYICMNCDSD
ncbi:unnamed protein product [Acanthoscelides obtectus]|uniref:HTH psq-type domain-containing protein n=1 Tax=Acanthoscelides obtectus TaxID=200917 RepID=A0A9P0PQH0_ACAOB|nr:unnamed protein product [Acanthoscelides obtectus]CAK1642534.1 hypothetical protein AOBTE_LOCUS13100 [Acanthoscelides obtectus]